jgi:hypothetical protein
VIEDQTHRAAADLRRELVARIAHDGSTFSGVGASGKPGAVHREWCRSSRREAAIVDLRVGFGLRS